MNSILVNQLLTNDANVRKRIWNDHQIQISSLDFCKHAYMTSDNIGILQKSSMFSEAAFYLQNPSSLLPVVALDPKPDEAVLDIAASPGGKTFHIACRMKNTGKLVANDLSRLRVSKMKNLLGKYGVKNAEYVARPGQILWQIYKDIFDKVLVDAPCTMCGTDTPSKDSPKKIAHVQKSLLKSAITCCKPGGIIVYSTCTNTLEENEEVIDSILAKESGVVELVKIHFPKDIPRMSSPFLNSKNQNIGYDTNDTFRVAKSDVFEGFFIAKFKKKEVSVKLKHK